MKTAQKVELISNKERGARVHEDFINGYSLFIDETVLKRVDTYTPLKKA